MLCWLDRARMLRRGKIACRELRLTSEGEICGMRRVMSMPTDLPHCSVLNKVEHCRAETSVAAGREALEMQRDVS